MSDLLKQAKDFNSLNDGISGKNPADVKLVKDLAERLEKVERGLINAFKHMESKKCLGDLPTSLFPLHDEFLDGDLK